MEKPQIRVLKKPEVQQKIQASDTTLWRWEKAGNFPTRIRLGGNSVGWIESEIDEWLEKKMAERI